MILSFIESTLNINSEIENIISVKVNTVPDNLELINTENVSLENPGNGFLQVKQNEEDSFEMKYKALMNKIETERFEREFLASNR